MKCNNCKTSVFNTPLHRVNPKGEDGIFWCMNCIESKEPELANNIKEDQTEIDDILHDVCYNKNK